MQNLSIGKLTQTNNAEKLKNVMMDAKNLRKQKQFNFSSLMVSDLFNYAIHRENQ